MPLPMIIFIAVGLAMDAFAVSVASGIISKKRKLYQALRLGLSFGVFQMVMPILGWFLGLWARALIAGIDHWIAFGILCFIGVKMIYEALRIEKLEKTQDSLTMVVLLGLSVATSIDALAVGISFAFLQVAMVFPAVIIGLITFAMCFAGFIFGSRVGHLFEQKVEILGGLILIVIGVKILIEHLIS